MSDKEWDSWQTRWAGATGPLPDVRARAQREGRLHRLSGAAFWILVCVGLAGSIPAFRAPEPEVHGIGAIIVAFCLIMSVGYLWLRREVRGEATHPRQALALLERRLQFEHRAAHLVRWAYLGLCAAFTVVFPRMVASHTRPELEMAISFPLMAVTLAVTFWAPWWVARRNRPHQEELARWRAWMDEQQL